MSILLNGLTKLRTVVSQNLSFVRNATQVHRIRNLKRLGPRPSKKLMAQNQSIGSRGFLRSVPAYEPPSDVVERVTAICAQAGLSKEPDTPLDDSAVRFNILNECFSEFKHAVPNSQLCTIDTVGDIVEFYRTPVITTTPYDALVNMDLPKNLHIQQNYVRFHPDTDTMFNGITAFPKTSCIVTGLKAKKKYKGFITEAPWKQVAKKV